jgi:hypothetical protein
LRGGAFRQTKEKKMTSLTKTNPNAPALIATGPRQISILSGTVLGGVRFEADTQIDVATDLLKPGHDYAVTVVDGQIAVAELTSADLADAVLGGFHFAHGGNACARNGGDTVPAINPCSIWDRNFRPACDDPRGMTRVETGDGKSFWCDIYLTAAEHSLGTSRCGANIADGDTLPQPVGDKTFDSFDYEAACAVMAHHGKGLLNVLEFFAAAYGVTEKTASGRDPKVTQLDAPRTSRWGVMQATGNMWTWGHDGDPDSPRASIFGGSWVSGGGAGSRYASLGYWAGLSAGDVGARGRSGHLQLG